MKTIAAFILSALTTTVSLADTNTAVRTRPHHRAMFRETRATGGFLVKPNTGKGKIVILNAQKHVPFEHCRDNFYNIERMMKLPLEFKAGEIPNGKINVKAVRQLNADLGIFIIDDAQSSSVVLVSPEERWATVNVRALMTDKPTAAVLEQRTNKEVMRAFGWLCGACNSKAKKTIMGPVATFEDLDEIKHAIYPIDLYEPTVAYLRGMGVVPKTIKTYHRACEEGWAPSPTNDYQKAIWDKVHAIPKNPMKIEFDPKKGR